jgi:hypothetical protein
MNLNDFLSGQFDWIFKSINNRFVGSKDIYTPVTPTQGWSVYNTIATTDENINAYVSLWQTLGTKYEFKVECKIFKDENKNNELKDILEKKIKLNRSLHRFLLKELAIKGNVVVIINNKNEIKGQFADFFEVFYDWTNNSFDRFNYIINNKVISKNLKHKKDLFYIRNPFNYTDIGTPPIDLVYTKILANKNLWDYINHQASSGLTGTNFFILDGEVDWEIKDNSGQTKAEGLVKIIKDFFRKTPEDKRDRVAALPYIKDIKKLASSIKDESVLEIIDEIKKSYAKAFGLTPQTLGEGNTTYNNVEALLDSQWNNTGKELQNTICELYNEFIFPVVYKIDGDIKVYVEKPQDEDQIAKEQSVIDLVSRAGDILTQQEKRKIIKDTFGLDLTLNEETEPQPQPQPEKKQFSKIKNTSYIDEVFSSPFFERVQIVNGQLTKKGFKPNIENLIKRQIERIADKILENNSTDLDKNFVKAESLYSFTAFKDDLQNFVILAKKLVNEKINFEKEEKRTYTEELNEYIDALITYNLKGAAELTDRQKELLGKFDDGYGGFDNETKNQIGNLIERYKEQPLDTIVNILKQEAEKIAKARASLITRMLTTSVVEKTRYYEHKDKGYKYKQHLGVMDDRETIYSRQATAKGVVPIDYVYNHQIGDGKSLPLHFNERSTMIYLLNENDLN